MKLALAALLLSTTCWADWGGTVALGPLVSCHEGQCFYGLAVAEPNHFDQETREYGFKRYGFGHGGIVIGNGIGLDMQSSSGFLLKPFAGPLRGAAEIGGRLWVNTNGAILSHYAWHPGLGVGPGFELFGARIQLLAKGGLNVSNYGYQDILPRFRLYTAAGLYLYTKSVSVGAEARTYDGQVHFTADALLHVYKDSTLGARIELLGPQTSGSIIFQLNPF